MERLRRALYNDTEKRPRALWRIVATGLLLSAGFGLAVLVTVAVLPEGIGFVGGLLLAAVVPLAVTVATLALAARLIDRREIGDFGLRIDREWWLDCGFGMALGAALMTLAFLFGYAAGWYRVTGLFVADGPFLPSLFGLLVLFLAVGIYEELLVRGYLLTNLAEGLRLVGEREAVALAIVASSSVFGVVHAANPGAGALSTAAISLAGVMLALGYVLTGELGVPIGIHVTWNVFQGPVFGLGVSGLDVGVAVVDAEPVGPELATGGAFGPEGGMLGIFAVLAGTAAIAVYARRYEGSIRVHPHVTTPSLSTDAVTIEAGPADEARPSRSTDEDQSSRSSDEERPPRPVVDDRPDGDEESEKR